MAVGSVVDLAHNGGATIAVPAAAIAAVGTSALGAVPLVVLSSAVGVFLAVFGLGVKVHDFFRPS